MDASQGKTFTASRMFQQHTVWLAFAPLHPHLACLLAFLAPGSSAVQSEYINIITNWHYSHGYGLLQLR